MVPASTSSAPACRGGAPAPGSALEPVDQRRHDRRGPLGDSAGVEIDAKGVGRRGDRQDDAQPLEPHDVDAQLDMGLRPRAVPAHLARPQQLGDLLEGGRRGQSGRRVIPIANIARGDLGDRRLDEQFERRRTGGAPRPPAPG
jgi:hypothetical protein